MCLALGEIAGGVCVVHSHSGRRVLRCRLCNHDNALARQQDLSDESGKLISKDGGNVRLCIDVIRASKITQNSMLCKKNYFQIGLHYWFISDSNGRHVHKPMASAVPVVLHLLM